MRKFELDHVKFIAVQKQQIESFKEDRERVLQEWNKKPTVSNEMLYCAVEHYMIPIRATVDCALNEWR